MATQTNTAADRLLRIVKNVYAHSDGPLIHVWAQVLEVSSKDKPEVFRRILSVYSLVDEVESTAVQQGKTAASLYVRSLQQIRQAIMYNLDGQRVHLNPFLRPEVIADLEHCAAMYASIDNETALPSETVTGIKKRVDELFTDITNSNLPRGLRKQMLDLLEIIRQQIAQYQIRGATALHDCLRQSVARLMEMYPEIEEEQENPLLKKFLVVISTISAACDATQKALPLLKSAGHFLSVISGPSADHTTLSNVVDAEVLIEDKKE